MRHEYQLNSKEIWALYVDLKSVWKVGDFLGVSGQYIHNRLRSDGYKLLRSNWSNEEEVVLKDYYLNTPSDDFCISEIADTLKRPYYGVAMKAKRLNLTDKCRPENIETKTFKALRSKLWHKKNPHPKGALGMKHTPETKKKISQATKRMNDRLTDDQKASRTDKMIKTKIKRGNLIMPRRKTTWKQSWETIGGKKNFYRSSWEVNYAHYLEWLKEKGELKDWEHEPETFWFENIKRGVRSYTPDFRIINNDDSIVFHEIKGWMDARSKTKIKRMAKYHPETTLIVIDTPKYKKLAKEMINIVPNWK